MRCSKRWFARWQGHARSEETWLRRWECSAAKPSALELCGYMPNEVPVRLPPKLSFNGLGKFVMLSAQQTDQIAWRMWSSGWKGFEQPLPNLFAACARDAGTVLDVGANSGLYTLIACAASSTVSVHAFEPLPQAIAGCEATLPGTTSECG